MTELLTPASAQKFCAVVEGLEETNQPFAWVPGGFNAVRCGGSSFAAEASVSRFEVGGRRRFSLILRNVQDQLAAENRLRELEDETAYLLSEITEQQSSEIIGNSPEIHRVITAVQQVAPTQATVLILGETGTGKELVARAIHQASGRGAFVAVNCGALPEQLLESELFGHEKGSFSGADRAKPGLFEAADGGVLLLDEIADLPLALQPKLMRALENGEVRRVGATESRNLDVRVIAATNRDLDTEVQAGRFRDDLFYRLNVLHISTPPLRERAADIPLLAEHFLQRDTAEGEEQNAATLERPRRITPEAMALLTTYPWPGNVRELRNAIQRAAVVATGEEVRPEDLPARIREASRAAPLVGDSADRALPLRDVERLYILEVLRQAGGNKSRAAELLGLDRKTLYRKLEEYRLDMETPTPA
jgi:DNA-binding NtrC family response regulator